MDNIHWIAHRGNLDGPNEERENSLDYLWEALTKGFQIEVDVWMKRGQLMLGHDHPQYPINIGFLLAPGRWCHAKNIGAMEILLQSGAHCFWHRDDAITLTSRGFVWTYPGTQLIANSVCLLLNKPESIEWTNAIGVCSDYVAKARELNDSRS